MAGLYDYGINQAANTGINLMNAFSAAKARKADENYQNIINQKNMFQIDQAMKEEERLNKDIMIGGYFQSRGFSPKTRDKSIQYLQSLGLADSIGRVKLRNMPEAMKAMQGDTKFQLDIAQDNHNDVTEEINLIDQDIEKLDEGMKTSTGEDVGKKKQQRNQMLMRRQQLLIKQDNLKNLMEKISGAKKDTSRTEAEILSSGGPEAERYVENYNKIHPVKAPTGTAYGDFATGMKERLKAQHPEWSDARVNMEVSNEFAKQKNATTESSLPQSTRRNEALKYIVTGTMPALGMSTKKEDRQAILNAKSDILNEFGISETEAPAIQQAFRADSQALAGLQKRSTWTSQANRQAQKNADALLQTSTDYKRSNYPAPNQLVGWVSKNLGNQKTQAEFGKFKVALLAFTREYMRVTTGAAASVAELSVKAQEKADDIISSSDSWSTLDAKVKQAKIEMDNTVKSHKEEADETMNRLKNPWGYITGDFAKGDPQGKSSHGAASQQSYTREDLEFTAKKYGISVDEVKRRLGAK